MIREEIISYLPYSEPFLFVDHLDYIDKNKVEGTYTFPEDSFFYEGHFKDYPVTPGVILTECMAQIGLVCLGIYLLSNENLNLISKEIQIAMSSTEIEFYKPVFPNEKVTVISEKKYFRFHKLKCNVSMYNSEQEIVAKGTIAGMMKPLKTNE